MANTDKIAILGAGSWGGTLSTLLASNNKSVMLWARNESKAEAIARTYKIEGPLDICLPANVEITSSLENCLHDASIIIFCCTAQSMHMLASQVNQILSINKAKQESKPIMLSAAKGIDINTFKRMSEILNETISNHAICALSGPNLAYEILQGLPTASVVASNNKEAARFMQEKITTPSFRVYASDDLIGVELGGSIKNVIAIAAGVADGLNLGVNAKAALMTRGLSEMTRLSLSLGAKINTLYGLSGMGDLVATCYSSLSRNYRLGYQMAQGKTLQEASASLGSVAEGATTTYAVCDLSKKSNIELPIAEHVKLLLAGHISPKEAIMKLMNRPLTSE
jgi:glycerol-3-phosphate dehydrogenase (NAD(P)+)